jgi:carbon monoxide dehydrogenase subunit G
MEMEVDGVFHKIFRIEAPIEAVIAFVSDYKYTLPRMPQVERVLKYPNDRYRMFYSADVVSGFKMYILFDITPDMPAENKLNFVPIPISKEDLINARTSGYPSLHSGKFSAKASFAEVGNYTEIDYRAEITLQVEVPNFLRVLPLKALFKMGSGILSHKMDSIGDDMAESLPHEYEKWSIKNVDLLEELLEN